VRRRGHGPDGLSRGNFARSSSSTSCPRAAISRAAVLPAGPAPTTMTSASGIRPMLRRPAVRGQAGDRTSAGMHEQHGDVCVPHDVVADRAEHEPADAAMSARADHDEIARLVAGRLDDALARRPLEDEGAHLP
jgi:hypothetical protein